MDVFERCIKAFGDPRFCSFVNQVGRLVQSLADCIEALDVGSCYRICLERCRGEECRDACLGTLKVAAGVAAARRVARRAAAAVALLGVDLVDAVALMFDKEVKEIEKMDCPEKGDAAQALAAAAAELYWSLKKAPGLQERAQDALLLMAPALAVAHQCVGDEVFEYLDLVKPFVEEEAVRRVVAALEEGIALIGNVAIKFKPVKVAER